MISLTFTLIELQIIKAVMLVERNEVQKLVMNGDMSMWDRNSILQKLVKQLAFYELQLRKEENE